MNCEFIHKLVLPDFEAYSQPSDIVNNIDSTNNNISNIDSIQPTLAQQQQQKRSL